MDGLNKAIVIDCKNWSLRSVQEPDNERVLQGPREGFNESLLTNLSLLRRPSDRQRFQSGISHHGRRFGKQRLPVLP